MRLPAAKAKGVSGWKSNCLIKGEGRGINTRGNDRLVLWGCLRLPGGTTAACPTCQLLRRTDCPAASTAWWLLPLFHPAVPCLLIDWLVVHSSDHLLPSVPIHRLSCWHIHYFQSPPPLPLFSRDVSLALVCPGLPNPDSALTRQPHLMSLLTNHAPSLHPLWLRMGGQAPKSTLGPHRRRGAGWAGAGTCWFVFTTCARRGETHPNRSSCCFILTPIRLQGETNISWPPSVEMASPLRLRCQPLHLKANSIKP